MRRVLKLYLENINHLLIKINLFYFKSHSLSVSINISNLYKIYRSLLNTLAVK